VAQHLLRGAVSGRDRDLAGGGEGEAVFGTGDAEVDDARPAGGEDDVLRLEVTVDQTRRVYVLKGGRDRCREAAQRRVLERAVRPDGLVERRTGEQLRGDPRSSAFRPGPEHPRDTTARDGLRRLGLAYEAPGEVLITGEFGVQDLHRRDGPGTVLVVLSDVDLAHAAFAENAEQAVRAEAERVTDTEGIHGSLTVCSGASARGREWSRAR
jgi:hypothetical protein